MDSVEFTGVDTRLFELGQIVVFEFEEEGKRDFYHGIILWKRGDQLYTQLYKKCDYTCNHPKPTPETSIFRSIVNEEAEKENENEEKKA